MTQVKTRRSQAFSTRTLAYCALLAALSVVLARLIIPMPDSSTRFSIEQVPIFLAGMLFGPFAVAMVGFAADFVGCLFSGYGYNPLFCLPPILYGLAGGLYAPIFGSKIDPLRLSAVFLPPVIIGSVLYQSVALAWVYYNTTFLEGLQLKLTTRSIQFAITAVIDIVIFLLLFKARIFDRMGLWPRKQNK